MTDSDDKDALAKWIEQLGPAIGAMPNAFGELFPRLAQARTEMRTELAKAIQPAFNEHLKTFPQANFEERHRLTAYVNHVLRVIDLAIRCPKTGAPCILIVEDADAQHHYVRYRFQAKGDRGRSLKTCPSEAFPFLELMPAPFREEGGARWLDNTGTYKGPINREGDDSPRR